MVNSKFGHNSWEHSSANEIAILDEYSSGKVLCSIKRGLQGFSGRATTTSYGSGSAQGTTSVSFYFAKDFYQIGVEPLTVKTTLQSNWTQAAPGNCAGKKGESHSNSTEREYELPTIYGKASYGDDPNILSGSVTTPTDYGNGHKVVETITWNLKRCSK